MRRLRELETEYRLQRRRLQEAYRELRDELADERAFGERWRALARRWRFDALNDLVREHNTWYPAEADLPMDPRTGDYVSVHGASYRRLELGPAWILDHLPASAGAPVRELPRRAPREPATRTRGTWTHDPASRRPPA